MVCGIFIGMLIPSNQNIGNTLMKYASFTHVLIRREKKNRYSLKKKIRTHRNRHGKFFVYFSCWFTKWHVPHRNIYELTHKKNPLTPIVGATGTMLVVQAAQAKLYKLVVLDLKNYRLIQSSNLTEIPSACGATCNF